MKNKNLITVLVVAAVLTTLTIVVIADKKKKKPPLLDPSQPCSNNNVKWTDDSFPLTLGSVGPQVGDLQEYLNSLGAQLQVDEMLGCFTQSAMEQLLKTETLSQAKYNEVFSGLQALNKDFQIQPV